MATEGEVKTPQPYRTVVIPDEPTGSDLFGGHKRVADGIVDLVRHSEGGRTIGLEGGWGSGKSTVVEIVRGQLEVDSEHRVFVYDTWAHEGDPLRRSFLEALGESLADGEDPWIDKELWKNTRTELARRKRTLWQHTTQEIPTDGRWVLGSLFLVPIGIALLNFGLGDGADWWGWIGGALTVAPVPVAAWRSRRIKQKLNEDEKSGKSRDSDSPDAWALLTRTGTTRQKTDTIETPDPTSIEFSETFDRLLGQALSNEGSRQLLIVLDNLDRVEARTALRTLSTLQSFFQIPNSQNGDWRRQLWVVLPYDRSGLKELWNDDEELLELFLSKIRNLRFEVPPLILSDWRGYIDHLISTAFPDAPPDVREEAAHVLVAARLDNLERRNERSNEDEDSGVDKSSLATPTPRNLIRVVNLMGSFHRSRPDIPLGHLAYYAVLRDHQVAVGPGLRTGSIPTDRVRAQIERDGQELIRNLAALHFNSDVEKAEELLLAEPLTTALRSGDVEGTRRLFQEHDRSLPAVLEQELDNSWAAGGGGDLAEMGKALVGAEAIGSLGEAMKRKIRGLIGHVESWQLTSKEQGLELARFVHELGVTAPGVTRLVTGLSTQSDEQLSGRALTGRIAGISGVMEGLVETGLWDAETDQAIDIRLPGSKEQVFVAAETLAREDPDRLLWRLVSPTQPSKELAAAVAAWPGKERSDGESIDALKVLSASQRVDFRPVVEATSQHLADANVPVEQVDFALETLEILEGGADKISELVGQGWVLHHLGRDTTSRAVPKLVFHQLNVVGGPPEQRQTQQPSEQQGLQFVSAFLEDPASQSELQEHLLSEVLKQNPDLPFKFSRKPKGIFWPWAKSTVVEIADSRPEIIDSDRLIDRWNDVLNALGIEETKKHIRRLRDEGTLVTALNNRSRAAEGDLTNIRGVLRNSIEEGPDAEAMSAEEPWYTLYSSARDWVRGRSIDEWKDALSDPNTSDVWLAKALANKSLPPELDTPFKEALVEYAGKLIKGEAGLPSEAQENQSGDWTQLPDLLGQQHLRDDLARALIGRLANAPSVDQVFWTAFGDFLSGNEQVYKHDRLLSDVIGEAVRRKDEATLNWAAKMLEGRQILDHHSRGSISTLKGLLKEELKEESPSEAIRRLAVSMGVRPPKQNSSPQESD